MHDHLEPWRLARLRRRAAAAESQAAYEDEIDALVRAVALDRWGRRPWDEIVSCAQAGNVQMRSLLARIAQGRVAQDLVSELQEKGARTTARLADDLDLPLGAVLAAAWALEVAGRVTVGGRRRPGAGLAVLARAMVELAR